MKRENLDTKFMSKVAIEAIKSQKMIKELSTEVGIHTIQINAWKKLLLKGSEEIFSKGRKQGAENNEEEKDKFYTQIGCLKVQVDWLKKHASFFSITFVDINEAGFVF